MEPAEKREYKVVFFVDLKNYTARVKTLGGTGVAKIIRQMHAVVNPVFETFGGEVYRTVGDSFLTVFDRADHAVAAAVDIQQQLMEINRNRDVERRLLLRIGIDCGEIKFTEISQRLELVGEPLNKASRLEAAANPGGILLSAEVNKNLDSVSRLLFERITLDLKDYPGEPCYYCKQFGKPEKDEVKQPASDRLDGENKTVSQIINAKKIDNVIGTVYGDFNFDYTIKKGDTAR